MDVDQIRRILSQNEGLKLDFKREYKLNNGPPNGSDPRLWGDLVKGQWHELIKDIIALANGNVGVPDEIGYLVIGADDTLRPDGTRQLFSVGHLQLTAQKIIARVNSVCEPPLPDILCEHILVDGETVCVISIPPTPYVHETNQQLATISGNIDGTGRLVNLNLPKIYTEYTAFIRKGENISPASANERKALETDKRFDLLVMEENLKFELTSNLKIVLSKSPKGDVYSPSIFYREFRDAYKITIDNVMPIQGRHIKWLAYAILFTNATRVSTRFLEMAINSGRYLSYAPQTGRFERSEFLYYLYELLKNIEKFVSAAELPGVMKFLTKYSRKGLRDDEIVRVELEDILAATAMLERFEDVVEISSSLLAYLLGNQGSLKNIELNDGSPIDGMDDKVAAETPTEDEVIAWVKNRR